MTSASLLILLNLFVLESLLSIDNAAVLAVMVKDLPRHQQPLALRYGMLGAFGFRGLCLYLASWLVTILWLKVIGGLYLLWLVYRHFAPKGEAVHTGSPWYVRLQLWVRKRIGEFWSTVILVEIMDLAFSIDNVFAAVAMTDNIYLIITGVCIGIVTMRFVATWFTGLMHKYPTLETSAFVVIALLGLKLVASGCGDYIQAMAPLAHFMNGHLFDLCFSGFTLLVFVAPLMLRKPVTA